jgi:hypothetical protein
VTERHPQVKAQSLAAPLEISRQPFGVVLRAFGHHDDRLRFDLGLPEIAEDRECPICQRRQNKSLIFLARSILLSPLMKMDQPSDEIGESAVKFSLGLLESDTPPEPQTILLEPKLLARDSTLR